jgi:hypothetical protein
LEDEGPQFVALLPAYYIVVFAVTDQQLVRFLSQTRPSSAAFGQGFDYWQKWNGKKRRDEPTDKSLQTHPGP